MSAPRIAPTATATALAAALLLAGCASVDWPATEADLNRDLAPFTQGQLALAEDAAAAARVEQAAQALLREPLTQDAAVRLALMADPALQALLAQARADMGAAAQAGALPAPVLALERLRQGSELEISRTLSVGLLDLLLWPKRRAAAQAQVQARQVQLAGEVVAEVTAVRMAWVRAVAAQAQLAHAHQVRASAEAAAELARRMAAVGNINSLTRARHHLYYAEAQARLAQAAHEATATREQLVRRLGLSDAQAQALRLPERLPDVPAAALLPDARRAVAGRIDVRLARAAVDAAAHAQGLAFVPSVVDVEASAHHGTAWADGERANTNGWELALRLPGLDLGANQRGTMNARTLAATQRHEATVRAAGSHLREAVSAWHTARELALHQQGEVLALRRHISDEQLLRYNAMLIGVFELLADARDQVAAVQAALADQEQFWLADAALAAEQVGAPVNAAGAFTPANAATTAPAAEAAEH